MTDEQRKAYVARVSQANKSQLIVLLYEMMETCFENANQAAVQEKWDLFEKECDQIRGFLNELMGSLSYEYKISFELMSLYTWADRMVVEGKMKKDVSILQQSRKILALLREAFEKVAKEDHSESVMEHAQTIYAGLTYGKNSLNETSNYENRGYQA